MSKNKLNCIEEELLVTIYRLIEKKTSKLFQKPVNARDLPDYYEKIRNPIDLSTMIQKLRQGKYKKATQLREDLTLMMQNCHQYNAINPDIIKQAEKFEGSIATQWGNFQKILIKKQISIHTELVITPELLATFDKIEERNTNKRPSNLQSVLGQLEQSRKPYGETKILPPIPVQLLAGESRGDELPSHLNFQPLKYSSMSSEEKRSLLELKINREELSIVFEEISQKKLNKYRKILYNRVMWIEKKIIQKCFQRKRFKKMSSTQYLSQYIDEGRIATKLQLRPLQMYVKMVAYWIENYPQILSHYMKNKFIQTCKTIKRAIFRVLRYRKFSRTTKIQVNLENENKNVQQIEEAQDESRKYDNEIKSFKRMLIKDESQTIKKHTKFQIKIENGQCVFVDWNFQNIDKKKPNRNFGVSRLLDTAKEQERQQRQRRKKEQKEQDYLFLKEYQPIQPTDLFKLYADHLVFEWEELLIKNLPTQIHLNFQGDQMMD